MSGSGDPSRLRAVLKRRVADRGVSERQRVPAPLLRHRLPSGRPAMLQPNVTGDGEARLTPRFWVMVVATGVVTGLFGVVLMLILFSVQHLAFGTPYDGEGTLASIEAVTGWRRFLPVIIGGAIAGPAWFLLRKYTPGKKSEVDDVLWTGEGRLSFRRSLGTSVISEVVIGLGASLGREAAPKLMGAVAGNLLAEWAKLSTAQQRLLVACGGGAGLAAVYNVPLGGALFTAEVLVGAINLPVMLPAIVCSATATATAWIFLPQHATYIDIPDFRFSVRLLVWALLVGVLVGVFAAGYVRLIGYVSHRRITGRWALIAPLVAFAVLGLLALRYPQLYGNGKGMAHEAFLGVGTIGLLAALTVLKPFVTMLCLGSGASGGLFTPVLSTGAVLGGFLGLAWNHVWPGTPVGAYAMVGAAAMIGAAMQAPLAAVALVLELTHSGFGLMVPMLLATALATALTRWIDGYSIYTARLAAPAIAA
ncbi:chloride channel protein, partial [Jatrophihabitans endophyticus]|uniref:chloride channel protein n=1 Tax=Jatrophihabitans endophyticus TaxID=1206085 RepID=UPI001A0B5FAE